MRSESTSKPPGEKVLPYTAGSRGWTPGLGTAMKSSYTIHLGRTNQNKKPSGRDPCLHVITRILSEYLDYLKRD